MIRIFFDVAYPVFANFLQRLALETGFRLVYPTLARMPAGLGLAGARQFGRLMARLDCEWRSVALREHFVARKTYQALAEIDPSQTDEALRLQVVERFMCACQEDLEGHWFARGTKTNLPVKIEGLEALQAAITGGRGLVLMTFHFDAALWGVGCLGRSGMRLNLLTSNIVEDPRVPTVVRAYFRRKYAGISRWLNGGQVMHWELHMRSFYRCLLQGDGVVVLADAHTHNADKALTADFLGRRYLFAPGVLRLASKTGAVVAAFVCIRENAAYRIVISPPSGPDTDAEDACRAALTFLESHVRAHPARWWAADLLPNFVTVE